MPLGRRPTARPSDRTASGAHTGAPSRPRYATAGEVAASGEASRAGAGVADKRYTRRDSDGLDLLRRKQSAVVAFLFDILEINGADLCGRPWRERRRFLERLMTRERDDALRLSDVWDDGPALLRAAGSHGLEGIVSKHREAPNRSGHTNVWIKVKVPGWTEAIRSPFK